MGRILGRVFILLLLIAILAGGGLVWFDYLNVIDAKAVLAPVYRLIGLSPRSQEPAGEGEFISLDAERLAVRLEALELRNMEMEKQEQEITSRQGEIEQMAQELEERQKALDERENSFNAMVEDAEIRSRNVEQNARYLNGMPPDQAVRIIIAMSDQDAIDVLRKTEEIAQAEGTSSIVSYWMSLMPPERAAELQRKMAGRPSLRE
ncbi:22.5 kDa protein [Treponema primitia ZAS-2]|uniref:22.5 kDa protein n=1 Tax=Treponema primitia (strain ATCC BAA-887 / DSM 12427 / ZAS-2) TaxID=545694 RepID=F5YPC3_TREPZ|nr:flagellar protein FlbB [Treponema primitia]AEF83912.1 22.5 kDa protein [Treponema primitia ZAS-2]